MCPISGMVQFLLVVVTLLLVCHSAIVHAVNITFEPKASTVIMYEAAKVNYTIDDPDPGPYEYQIYVQDSNVGTLWDKNSVLINETSGTLTINGQFLGKTTVYCKNKAGDRIDGQLDLTVVREKRVIDTVFTSSVATLVSIIYINFGCALNWSEIPRTLRRPVGPVIAFVAQFAIMPLLSFGLGRWLFPDNAAMQLGMFFTGVSPGGGASNIWTVVLNGNVNLSITMTTISTLAAFFMMPAWLFTLGKVIFDKNALSVPYSQISTYAVALVVPLAVGWLLARYMKRVAAFLVRILKGFSGLLLVFIVVFAIVTNLYLFQLFSWEIVIAGMGLPWLGYMSGYILAKLFKQPPPDCLAIAVETGIQNTGIAIFLLRFTLPQPEADLTTVAPVSVAIMTPLPLLLIFLYQKLRDRISPPGTEINHTKELLDDSNCDVNTEDKGHDNPVATIS